MTKARDIILEIKRKLGDVNVSVPDESDILAFLNKALLGIYNYGVYKNSSRLRKMSGFTVSANSNTVSISDNIAVLNAVSIKDKSGSLIPIYAAINYTPTTSDSSEPICYSVRTGTSNDEIVLYPTPTASITVVVDYIPQFTKLSSRDSSVPFTPMLENIIVDWTIWLINNRNETISDYEFAARLGFGNAISRFFRGWISGEETICEGPW